MPGRGSVTVFALSLVVLFGGCWYFSMVLCSPYTAPVTSIKKNPGLPLYLDQRMHYLSCGLWTEILALKNYPL